MLLEIIKMSKFNSVINLSKYSHANYSITAENNNFGIIILLFSMITKNSLKVFFGSVIL